MNKLVSTTIAMVLLAMSLYLVMSFIAAGGGGFPFLIGAGFLAVAALAVVLGTISCSMWVVRYAERTASRGALVGAWVAVAGLVSAAGTVLFQLYRGGAFWQTLFGDLLWSVTIATVLLWLGFLLLLIFSRKE